MVYEHITLTRSDEGIVTLTFNRPETRNSMTPAMGDEVVAAVGEIRADSQARVFVLTGAGKAFSSGGDLGMLARDSGAASGGGPSMLGAPRDFYARYLALRQLAIPTIAAINGHAIGAGLCIALACDLRMAASDAKMGMTFAKLGIHPGMGATYFLPRLIGTARAAELFFTGRVFDAAEAERLGVINRAVPREQLHDQVMALAREIAGCAPLAVRMTKKALYRGGEHSLDDMLDFEALQQGITFTTDDAREGVLAIMEKRTPKFRGA
ncbi:MAG: enoyl-CoA hydratase/isomerase family protein [Deltaproteobacteria bacterium]|nr:enoyl-CoA hydratase/isomerase family protein [Deltaproteobacteria bacterium]